MRYILDGKTFTFCLLLIWNRSYSSSNDSLLLLKVDVDVVSYHEKSDQVNIYSVLITLKNTQDTTLSFWTRSCNWPINFITNNDSIGILPANCDSEGPTILKIGAHKTAKFYAEIHTSIDGYNPGYTNTYFKLGFLDIPKSKISDRSFYEREKKGYKIYWSNQIRLAQNLGTFKTEE